MIRHWLSFLFIVLPLASAHWAVSAELQYYVTDLGTLNGATGDSQAFGINSFGQVVGYSGHSAFLWSPVSKNSPQGTMVNLGGLSTGQNYSEAWAINSMGQVVGRCNGQAFLWTPDTWNSTNGVMIGLDEPLTGYKDSDAFGINDLGQVVGRHLGDAAYLWTPSTPNGTTGTLIELGELPGGINSSWAHGINALGVIAGESAIAPKGNHVFIWKPSTPNGSTGEMIDVGNQITNDALSNGRAINSIGQIVGWTARGNHAFLWTPFTPNTTSGVAVDLGTLPGGSRLSSAFALNSSGWVVGDGITASASEAAFLWKPDTPNGTTGTMIDLNSVLDPTTRGSWVFQTARGINDAGQIVGYGRINGRGASHALLLTPIPEPATFALVAMLSAAALLIARCRNV